MCIISFNFSTHRPACNWTFLPLALQLIVLIVTGFLVGQASAGDGAFRVTLSDDVIVLDEHSRSGSIDLVNLGEDPMEFTLKVDDEAKGAAPDGTPLIRWTPTRSLVPANRSVAMRVAARPPANLAPGEYIFRVNVTASVQRPKMTPGAEEKEAEKGIAVTIPVVPVLPVTVYVRHKIETPMIDAKPLVLTPEDKKIAGYFPVTKRMPGVSFVGQIQLVEQGSGKVVNQGRLVLAPATDTSKVSMPLGKIPLEKGARYCLRVWDHFPGEGAPKLEVCGQ